MNKINYVIAKKWPNSEAVGTYYTYNQDVFYGTIKEARNFAKIISDRENEQYDVYVLQKLATSPP